MLCALTGRGPFFDIFMPIVSDEALNCSIGLFGARHLMFGSDWPFAMGIRDPHAYLSGLNSVVAEQLRRAGIEQ